MKIIDIKGKSQPDPYVIKEGGCFYIYCTGGSGVECYKSKDLFDGWEYVGTVLNVEGQKEYWAPAVIKLDGRFYMYYSSMPVLSGDAHQEAIKVAVSNSPDGKFEYIKDLLPPFSIDAHVVKNEAGLYIFYSVNDYDAEKAGTYMVCDKMTDALTVEGKPVAVVRPTIEEEIFQKNRFIQGQDWYTIEGAFYFYKDGWHYVIYSANSYLSPDYHLGYAAVKSDEKDLCKLTFKKISESEFKPLLKSNAEETGTGHNSLIELDGKYYIVYHGRDMGVDYSDKTRKDDRTARVCRLVVKDGALTAVR